MANEVIEKAKDNMKKSIAVFQKELGGIRACVANASLLDGIKVNYYGVPTPLTQMSSVSIPEARRRRTPADAPVTWWEQCVRSGLPQHLGWLVKRIVCLSRNAVQYRALWRGGEPFSSEADQSQSLIVTA